MVLGTDAKVKELAIGIQQKQCCRPLLFLVYINYLLLVSLVSNISIYAHGASIYYQSHQITQLNEDQNDLDRWLKKNKLSSNLLKARTVAVSINQ